MERKEHKLTGIFANSMSRTGASLPYVPFVALALTMISALLSIFGAIVIFWIHFRYIDVRVTSRRLLLFLTVADFMTAIGNLLGTLRYTVVYNYMHEQTGTISNNSCTAPFCVAQSFWTTYSSISSFFWTMAITLFFYLSLIYKIPAESVNRLMKPFHIICWGAPGIICVVAVSCEALGDDHSVGSGAWCWINDCLSVKDRIMWMIIAGKGWEILTYFSSFMLLVIFVYQWRNQPTSIFEEANDRGGTFREQDKNFFFIPLVLYILRMWGTIRFIVASSSLAADLGAPTWNTLQSVLLNLQCIGDSGQAFFNFVLFCLLDKPVRHWMFSGNRERAINTGMREQRHIQYRTMEETCVT